MGFCSISEQIPLLYPGGIEAFYEQEVKPYDAEAEFGEPITYHRLRTLLHQVFLQTRAAPHPRCHHGGHTQHRARYRWTAGRNNEVSV